MKPNLATAIHELVNKRRPSAGSFRTSTAGAVTSLILLSGTATLSILAASSSFIQNASAATITMSSSGAQSIDVMTDSTGSTGTSIGVDNLNIATDCRAGYNLSISTSVNDNNLYLNGSSSNNTSGTYFTPANGSSTLVGSPNTWGYLVSDSAPTASSTFSAVPVLSSPSAIRTAAQTASQSDINDNIDIYYGVAVSNGLAPGTYKMIPDTNNVNGGIVYYMTMETSCEFADVTINAGKGISTLAADGWTDTGTATITKTYPIGTSIDLSSIITPNYTTGYNGTGYTKTAGDGILDGSSYMVGSGINEITINATGINTPVCSMKGGTGKVYNRSATTLTATDNSTNFDTDSINLTYSFGYASSATAVLGNFGSAQSSNTISVAKNAFRGARHYGVTVTATDKTDSTMTATCTSGTGSSTGTTVSNRTTMTIVNARVNFDATTNGGTLNGTTPIYVAYDMSNIYAGRTNATAASIPLATPPTGYTFDGWYTNGNVKIVNADGSMAGNTVTNWSTADGRWRLITTSTTSTSTANTLYAHYTLNTYSLTITFAGDGVSSVKVCTVSGDCSGDDLTGTVSSSGGSVSGLSYGTTYYLYPTFASSHVLDNWANTGSYGTLSSTSVTNPTFTMGDGDGAVVITGKNNCSNTISGYMQDITSASVYCSGASGTLTDRRDNKTYTVAKLPDDNIWMTKNLDLAGGRTLTSSWTNLNGAVASYTLPASSASGFSDGVASTSYVYNSNSTTCGASSPCYSYYSYKAATAGTDPASGSAASDICPRGWRLPTSVEYTTLKNNYATGSILTNAPFLGTYSGQYSNSSFSSGGSYGYYWSSTARYSDNAYNLYFGTNNASVGASLIVDATLKNYGRAIRCIVKQ